MESRPEKIEIDSEALKDLITGMWERLDDNSRVKLYASLRTTSRSILREAIPGEVNQIQAQIADDLFWFMTLPHNT